MNSRQNNLAFLLMCLNALLLLPWLGLAPFTTRGEPREAIVAQSIIRDHNWILPAGYGDDVPSKPPLLHWGIALASYATGEVSETTARLPSALAAIAFIFYFSLWVAKRRGALLAGLSGFILFTSFEWLRASQGCRVDMVHSAALAAGICVLFSWHERGAKSFPLAAVILLSFATLTKGPVALILAAGVFGLFSLVSSVALKRIISHSLLIFIPVIALSSIWYLLAYQKGGAEFWEMVVDENFRRFTSSMDDTPHKHGIMYLFGTTFLGLMPWSLGLLVPLALSCLRQLRQNSRTSIDRVKIYFAQLDSFAKFCIIAASTIFIFYCIPSSKRSVYVLAAYPFIAIGLSNVIVSLKGSVASCFKYGICTLLALVALLFLSLTLVLTNAISLNDLGLSEGSSTAFYLGFLRTTFASAPKLALLVGLAMIACISCVRLMRVDFSLNKLLPAANVLILVLLLVSSTFMPVIARSVSPREFSVQVAQIVPANEKLYSFGSEFYATSFYINRPIYSLAPTPVSGAWVVLERDKLDALQRTLATRDMLEIVQQSESGFLKPKDQAVLVRLKR